MQVDKGHPIRMGEVDIQVLHAVFDLQPVHVAAQPVPEEVVDEGGTFQLHFLIDPAQILFGLLLGFQTTDHLVQHGKKGLLHNGLQDIIRHTQAQSFLDKFKIIVPGNDDDHRFRQGLLDGFNALKSV